MRVESRNVRFSTRLFIIALGLVVIGPMGGCPEGNQLPSNNFFSDLLGLGNADGSVGADPTSGPPVSGLDPDPVGAYAIVERQPETIAVVEDEDSGLAQIVDADANVHEFVTFADGSAGDYLAEYRYESGAGTLHVTADSSGRISIIDIYDAAAESALQLALSWSDATHALVNMTTGGSSTPTAFEIELDAVQSAKLMNTAAPLTRSPKAALAAQPTEEQKLSLLVKIRYEDRSGSPVSGLRTTFRLRALDNSATFGVARGDEIGPAGQYLAQIPAYRYQRAGGDYPEWKPYFERGVILTATATAIIGLIPSAPVWVSAGAAASGLGLTSILPPVVDRVLAGEYSNVPYPTALGQDIEYFEVRVSAADRKNTTVIYPIRYDVLYEDYIEPRQFLDLGTVTVDPVFEQPAPGYRLYRVTQIGVNGQVEVLPDGSQSEDIPLCRFVGGGLDCSILADLQTMSAAFPTEEAAVRTICADVTEIKILPLGVGPGARFGGSDTGSFSDWTFLSYEVYNILQTCVD